jgi:hypothetical protein
MDVELQTWTNSQRVIIIGALPFSHPLPMITAISQAERSRPHFTRRDSAQFLAMTKPI